MEKIEECVCRVSVQIPWNEVNDERRRLIRQVARTTTVPGFRKGKAPLTVLNRYFEREILETLKDGLVKARLFEEIGKHDLRVAFGPMIDELRLVEGRPLEANARFEVFPDFELGKYRRLQVLPPQQVVTDDVVDDYIEWLRSRHGSYRNIDPRPIRDGDTVRIVIEGTSGGREPEIERHETNLVVGHPETLADYSDALRGLSPGDSAEFDVNYPENTANEQLAGKTLRCNVEVQGISELEMPDLDDEFAKDVDDSFDTLEALKAGVRQRMEDHRRREALEIAQSLAIQQLADLHPMPLPPQYMERRLQRAEEDAERSREQGGNSRVSRPLEEKKVRADLVLERIAQVENLTVSKAETDEEIRRFAQSRQLTPDSARQTLEEQGAVSAWRVQRRRTKALQFVIDEAERIPLSPSEPHDREHAEDAEGIGEPS